MGKPDVMSEPIFPPNIFNSWLLRIEFPRVNVKHGRADCLANLVDRILGQRQRKQTKIAAANWKRESLDAEIDVASCWREFSDGTVRGVDGVNGLGCFRITIPIMAGDRENTRIDSKTVA